MRPSRTVPGASRSGHAPQGWATHCGPALQGPVPGRRGPCRDRPLTCCRHRSRDSALRSLSFCLVRVMVSLMMSPK